MLLKQQKVKLNVGDRVLTSNQLFGRVVRLDHDQLGEYIVVRLDGINAEFAYDPWDLKPAI